MIYYRILNYQGHDLLPDNHVILPLKTCTVAIIHTLCMLYGQRFFLRRGNMRKLASHSHCWQKVHNEFLRRNSGKCVFTIGDKSLEYTYWMLFMLILNSNIGIIIDFGSTALGKPYQSTCETLEPKASRDIHLIFPYLVCTGDDLE